MSIISFLAGLLLIVMGGCATLRGMADDAENLGKGLKKTLSEMEGEGRPTPSSSRRITPPNGDKSSKEPNAAQVKQAQEQLKAAGFNPGPLDGILGPQARAALREKKKESSEAQKKSSVKQVKRKAAYALKRKGEQEPVLELGGSP